MAFSGTKQKCQACDNTVYLVDQLIADGIIYHKACFRCFHCKRTLNLSDYSSFEGVPYCKPHFEQLFKLTGSFDKSFEAEKASRNSLLGIGNGFLSTVKPIRKVDSETPKTPSKASFFFSGTQDKCISCGKTVYPLDKVSLEGLLYHRSCFKCVHGGCFVSPSSYATHDGRVYCKHHYSQLFKEKGDYSQLSKIPTVKPIPE